MGDLLGEDAALAESHKLYRCLDKLLEHKEALFTHLQERWKTLFDVLLAHVHESAQRFHESAQPWSCPAGAALEVATHTAPRGGMRGRRLTLVAF